MARKAYFAYVNQGSLPGHDVRHWLAAESELIAERNLRQARQELTSVAKVDPKDAFLESAPESERWDPVHGSTGNKAPTNPSEDEDEEGRSSRERLVESGIAEADLDHGLQAAKAAAKKDS